MRQGLTFRPNVNHLPHKFLESEANEYLQANNFETCSLPYYEFMPEKAINLLKFRFDMTSLYIRGRSDRLAIHKSLPITFEYEAKTHGNTKYQDLAIELLPLMHHISESKLGVECLYILKTVFGNGGFWINKIPAIRNFWIPPRKEYDELRNIFKNIIYVQFGDVHILEGLVGGSGDPFVIIDRSIVRNLPDWHDLIKQRLLGLTEIQPNLL
jgi:hypothetical protein